MATSPTMTEKSLDGEALESQQLLSEHYQVDDRNEKDAVTISDPRTEYEHGIPARLKMLFLGGYMLLNMTMTLYNKALMQEIPCPWLLTTLHAAFTAVGCSAFFLTGRVRFTALSTSDGFKLLGFSILFTVNIAISNVSLHMVSIPLHQTIRCCTPLFTVLIYRIVYGRQYSTETHLSLVPVVAGAALTAYGDLSYTKLGLFLTIFGVILAAVKTIATNRVMTGTLKLPAIEVLARMSSLAALQSLTMALISGEDRILWKSLASTQNTRHLTLMIVGNGLVALFLNLASFQTNKLAGALALTVCANIKQTLTIIFGAVMFNVHIGLINGVGMTTATVGAALFSWSELKAKQIK